MIPKKSFSISANTFFSLLARGTELSSSFLTIILAARYLGVEGFGEFAVVRAISYICTPLISFGTIRILIRDISVDKNKTCELFCSGLAINLIIGLPLIIITIIVPIVTNLEFAYFPARVFAVALIAQLFYAMIKTISSVFIAYEKIYFDFIVIIISGILTIAFVILAVFFNMPGIYFFYGFALANLLAFIISLSLMNLKLVRLVWHTDYQRIKVLFKQSFPITIAIFMTEGYNNIFVFFLKMLRDTVEVSFFQAPQRIIQQSLVIPRSFFFAYVPFLSRMAAQDHPVASLRNACSMILKYIFIFTLPASMIVTAFSDQIIIMAFGPGFANSADALKILIWAINLLFVNVLLDNALTSMRKQNLLIISNGLCLIVGSIAGFVLVREYGYIGACWATLLNYSILASCNFYFVCRYIGTIPMHSIGIKPILCAIIPGMILVKFPQEIHMAVLITGSLTLYAVLLFMVRTFTQEEIQWIKQMASGKFKKRNKKII